MDIFVKMAEKIIKEQEQIMGPVALEQAKKVEGLEFISDSDIKIVGDTKNVLGKLVDQYAKLFGRASIEVCKEAIHEIQPPVSIDQLPEILR